MFRRLYLQSPGGEQFSGGGFFLIIWFCVINFFYICIDNLKLIINKINYEKSIICSISCVVARIL